MTLTAGIDMGSTYVKVAILDEKNKLISRSMLNTGFRLAEAAQQGYARALEQAGLNERDVSYIVSTGYGRYQVPFRDIQVTDLTAQAKGASLLFPKTKTVLDIGGQTMKASRLDERAKVRAFRMNDKCAAGTGAFLEKAAFYLGYKTEEIGPLVGTSKAPASVSGVCAVFAESEVINHVSNGISPADVMAGAMVSLVDRAVQLLRRVKMEPEYTLVGGILRFKKMVELIREKLKAEVNVPPEDLAQFTAAIGAALLGRRRLEKLRLKNDGNGERAAAA